MSGSSVDALVRREAPPARRGTHAGAGRRHRRRPGASRRPCRRRPRSTDSACQRRYSAVSRSAAIAAYRSARPDGSSRPGPAARRRARGRASSTTGRGSSPGASRGAIDHSESPGAHDDGRRTVAEVGRHAATRRRRECAGGRRSGGARGLRGVSPRARRPPAPPRPRAPAPARRRRRAGAGTSAGTGPGDRAGWHRVERGGGSRGTPGRRRRAGNDRDGSHLCVLLLVPCPVCFVVLLVRFCRSCDRIEPRGCDSYAGRKSRRDSPDASAGRARWNRRPPERLFVIQPERTFGVKRKSEQVFAPNA